MAETAPAPVPAPETSAPAAEPELPAGSSSSSSPSSTSAASVPAASAPPDPVPDDDVSDGEYNDDDSADLGDQLEALVEQMSGMGLPMDDVAEMLSQKRSKARAAAAAQPPCVLETLDAEGVAKAISTGKCKNVIVMSGAGLSVSAGIPDFRSPKTGLYHNLQRFHLKHPEDIFDIDFFEKNPKPFFVLAKELYPGLFKATKGHHFIRLLESKGLLLRNYTQNIDTLESIAGISDEKLVYAHGSFSQSHCVRCHAVHTLEYVKEKVLSDAIPLCTMCGSVVKPDIVFFGEDLPERFYNLLHDDFAKCDLLLVFGTSLVVYPFASLVDRVARNVPRVLINREPAGNLARPNSTRDVFLKGDCDDGAQKLADLLGWGEELKAMCAAAGLPS
eukprot:m51a1_g2776 putative nad-dependent deacetylase sirtuin 2 homolog (389) ;mRNA; r:1039417-1040940